MDSLKVGRAIKHRYGAGVPVSCNGDYESLMVEGMAKPTEKHLAELLDEYDAHLASIEYQSKRAAEYPSLEECIHAILDGDTQALQDKRTAIKAKYPKP